MSESRGDQLFNAFAAFHRENPTVWELFEIYTLAIIDAGFTHYSANAIFERIRWHRDTETKNKVYTLKLNNNFRCFYARLFHAAYPHYGGFFRNRRRPSEEGPEHKEDVQEWNTGPDPDEAALAPRLLALLNPPPNPPPTNP